MVDILEIVKDRDPQEREFHQAVGEVMESVKPVLDHKSDLSPGQNPGTTG